MWQTGQMLKSYARRFGVFIGITALVAASGLTSGAAAIPAEWKQFRTERAEMALALSEPIAKCLVKHDTSNPVFHGCIDWHSAVHGTWALTAYTWATADPRYRPLLQELLQPSRLEEERKHLRNSPDFEMPYGRAWFLRLAIDYHRTFATDLLDGFADDIAASLVAYYTKVQPDPLSSAYESATWALINLYDYGVSRGRADITDFVKDKVRKYYVVNVACPLQEAELATGEFMAICTNWAWLVGKVLPKDKFAEWLTHFLPKDLPLDPVTKPITIHQTGLNFSRAWGLWNLYTITHDSRWLMLYLRHFNETFTHPALWKGDYRSVAHWVPQFGMLDLIVTYYTGE